MCHFLCNLIVIPPYSCFVVHILNLSRHLSFLILIHFNSCKKSQLSWPNDVKNEKKFFFVLTMKYHGHRLLMSLETIKYKMINITGTHKSLLIFLFLVVFCKWSNKYPLFSSLSKSFYLTTQITEQRLAIR